MLSSFRAFAKSPLAGILIAILVISFGLFGVRDVFKGHLNNEVVVAGKRTIGPQDFKTQWDQARKGLEQQSGQPVTTEMMVENHYDARLIDELATREAFAALLDKIGLRPSDQLIKAQIEKIPAFFDQVSGRFDKALYQQTLQQNNLTVDKFEASLRDEISQTHLVSAIVDGLRAPRAYTALGAIYMTETRDVGYFSVGPGAVPAVAPPTDAQLTKFMQNNASRLMRPEFRVLTVVRFSPTLVGANLPVTDAEIQKQFDFRKDTLNKPEVRSLVQIPAKDAVSAQAIATRLAKGEDPRAIAKSTGVEAIIYVEKPKAAIADPKVGDAAFAMTVGAVQVVQGGLGPAVVKVFGISPGHVATIAEVRPMLEAEARKTAAAEKVYELSQKYDDAHAGGASLIEASAKAGVPTMTLGPVSQQGASPLGQAVPGLTLKLVQTAFALPQGGESEIEDEGNGESFAVHVDKIIPKALPALSEVRPRLVQVWMAQEVAKRLRAKADDLTARVEKGESLESVAGSVGGHVAHLVGLDRQNAGQNKDLSQESLSKIFGLKVGEAFNGEDAKAFGIVVGKIEALRGPVPTALGRMAQSTRPQLTQTLFREIGADARKSAKTTIKPKTNANVARAALGLEPLDPKTGKAAEKAK